MGATGLRQFIARVVVVASGIALVACSPGGSGSPTVDVPLQTGAQTTLLSDMGLYRILGVDGKNVLYLGGATGIATLPPGATTPTPVNLEGGPALMSFAVAPDGRLYLAELGGVLETVAPGSLTPEPLPFQKLEQFSDLTAARDGTLYLRDNGRDQLLKYTPGADAPTDLRVDGLPSAGHMAIDADNDLFVYDAPKILKIAQGSTTAEPVGGDREHVGGLAVDAGGNLYATDNKADTVSRLPAGGGDWEELPFSGLENPTEVVVDGDGNVYVVNRGSEIVTLAAT